MTEKTGSRAEPITDLWVCVDCLLFIANGDVPDDKERLSAIINGIEKELPGVWVLDGPRDVEVEVNEWDEELEEYTYRTTVKMEPEDADTQEFSWSSCDCCDSHLGGSRHRAAIILVGGS